MELSSNSYEFTCEIELNTDGRYFGQMHAVDDLMEYFLSQTGIIEAIDLPDAVFSELWYEEMSVKTQCQSNYENEGFLELSKRNHKVCLFLENDYNIAGDARVTMLDGEDKVIGMSLLESEKP